MYIKKKLFADYLKYKFNWASCAFWYPYFIGLLGGQCNKIHIENLIEIFVC